MVAVSVVVPVVDDLEQVKRLVRSLDLQTLPVDDFEVLLSGGDGEAAIRQLDALAAHRPNMKVVRTTDPVRELLAAVEGDFVLIAHPDETLFPDALARLRDFAEQHSADAVAGRVVTPGDPAPLQLWIDAPDLEDRDLVATLTGAAAGVPRQLFVRRDAAELIDGGVLQTAATRIAVLGSHAITLRHGQPVPDAEDEAAVVPPTVTVDTADWREGSLHLVLRTTGIGSAPGEHRAVLQLTHTDTQETFLVPAEVSTASGGPSSDGSPAGAELVVAAAVAPTRTPAAGRQLAEGTWQLSLVLASGGTAMPPIPIPWSPCPPALIGSTAMVPARTTVRGLGSLTLDVGPVQHPLLSDLDPQLGTVTESVVGAELALDLPQLQVSETDGLDGFIALDKMRLPARIRVRDGRPQLVALVSGLAGRPVISAQFGPGPLRPTGLSLQISGVGAMSVIKTPPPPAPQAPAKPPSAPKPSAKSQSSPAGTRARARRRKKIEPPRTGVIADLRRAVPAPLEPVVKRLASIPAARRLYRRVTR